MFHRICAWFWPKPTGDPGRDRNTGTLQFACFLLTLAFGAVAVLNTIEREPVETPLLVFAVAGLISAAGINRAGKSILAARTAFLAALLAAALLVFEANDGFRSHAMLIFPGLLLISVMLLDRTSYLTTAGIVLIAVSALGIAEKQGLTRAVPHVRTPTSYGSIFIVDLSLSVFALIGSRIARDTQKNVLDLRAGIDRLSATNLELIQIKEHLLQSEQRLKSAQRLARVGSWHWNLEVNRITCSEECKRILGQPDDYSPTLEGLLQIILPGERTRVANEIQSALTNRTGCSTEFRILRPDGGVRTVSFISQALLKEDGTLQHIFGACQDVTDERRAQEEAFARHKFEIVGRLANGIAHDFNNLLGSVLAQAELALSELADGSRPDEELKAICSVAMNGAEIVRQLMIYAGNESEMIAAIDLSETIVEMLELLKVSVSTTAVLVTDLGRDLPALQANASQIRRIVMNLVTNGTQAIGDSGGLICIRTGRVAAFQSSAVAHESPGRDFLVLEISDTGCGMSAETQSKVFDPFFTTRSSGHGLGLAVVQGIVRSLSGTIHLVSEPAMGTTFRILLPAAATAANTPPRPDVPIDPGPEHRAATVLVVEDQEVLRTAAAKVLRTKGFSVLAVEDGTAALVAIRGPDPIDVLLLDVTLPGLSSREVLAEARLLRPAMRVIVTSAHSEDFSAASLHTSLERFIRKPYSSDRLVELIRRTLSEPRATGAAEA